MKANNSTASKSTELTDATESKVSTLNPDFIMKSDNSTNLNPAVNSDNNSNADNSTTANTLFAEETASPTQPKQQRIVKQQRKSDFAEFKATYLTPTKLVKRHLVNIEDSIWAKLERTARILGDRGANVGSYINAVLSEHLNFYADDIEIWRKL